MPTVDARGVITGPIGAQFPRWPPARGSRKKHQVFRPVQPGLPACPYGRVRLFAAVVGRVD